MHYLEGGFEGTSATLHMIFGTSIAVIATLAWWLQANMEAVYRTSRHGIAVVLVLLVTMAGHYGGNLTHGSTYLIEYAPNFIRAMAGLGARRPPVTDLAMADTYLDVVQPILSERCGSCHSDDTQRGDLNLASFDAMMRGGETGSAVVAGNSAGSELFRRITLAPNHDEFMPAEGRTPLTDQQTQVLGWWIDAGAPIDTSVATLDISGVRTQLLAVLGLYGSAEAASVPVTVDTAALDALFDVGFQARQRAIGEALLTVSLAHSPAAALTDAHLDALAVAPDQIAELNLRRANVQNEQLSRLGGLSNLTHLSLADNAISDDGLAALAELHGLQTLNLSGNRGITGDGLAVLAELDNLQALYLWGTNVSDTSVAELQGQLTLLDVDRGTAVAVDYGEPAQIAGVWEVDYVAGAEGPKTAAPMTLGQTGDSATGTLDEQDLTVTIRGSDISFVLAFTTPFGPDNVRFNGTVSGDRIEGQQQSNFGNFPWTALRTAQ